MQNIEDREAIILKYVPLVEKVVRHIGLSNPDYEKSDLVNIGVIGLMDASINTMKTKKCLLKIMHLFGSKGPSSMRFVVMARFPEQE
ncbi:hypothetical protein SDC9_58523 [bioreactor metagenome]|uniref:Uncharacterized protein n=1 Tax=bioreactor metagenome TaxID=1076179 RepID=A0A644X8N2_9ZZZZ